MANSWTRPLFAGAGGLVTCCAQCIVFGPVPYLGLRQTLGGFRSYALAPMPTDCIAQSLSFAAALLTGAGIAFRRAFRYSFLVRHPIAADA